MPSDPGPSESHALPARVDVAIVGAGISGIAMAASLRRAGRTDFVLLERGEDVGGTWRDNAYPGCACDVPSLLYSFSFAPNPDWSSTYSPQQEIQAYVRRVAREQGLMPHVHLRCDMIDARWDGSQGAWRIETSQGVVLARVLIAAAGPLAEPKIPPIAGLESFEGTVFHSSRWDHAHDLTGRRVAVVGTGASSIQFVPQIQPRVAKLTLFQRTPPWVVPRPARALSTVERAVYRSVPRAQRAVREAIYWSRELLAIPLLRADYARYMRGLGLRHLARQVPDEALRARLTPGYLPGCKRILISNDYYPALARPNVEVVSEALAEVRPHSVVARDGSEHAVDTLIFGTGFHVTDMPITQRVHGVDGRTMLQRGAGSLAALRGTTAEGFPNFFVLLGPNTGLGHTSVLVMAEAQVTYVMKALEWMDTSGARVVEPRPDAQARWNAAIQARMPPTVWMAGGCASWYIDVNGVNSTIWPDFTFRFRRQLERFDGAEYRILPAAEATA